MAEKRKQAPHAKAVDRSAVVFHGKIVRGVIRGRELVERFADRLEGLLGFRPYYGTLNVQVERPVDIEDFETKRLEHILIDGSLWIDARLAPVKLTFKDKSVDAWIIVDERGLHENDVLEVIHKDRLMDKLGLKLGDEVIVELRAMRRSPRSLIKSALRGIWPRATRINR